MTSISLAERLAGGVWGHLVGDAVGVPYEFGRARSADSVVFGHVGTYHQRAGTWSDDGALMLSLLDSLLETKGFDTTDQATRALDWYRGTAYTPDGDGRFDIGGITSSALDAFADGTPAESAGPTGERSNGNGSLMRILPLALVERDISDANLVDHAHRASRVTHGHPRSQVACALYVLIARRLLTGSGGRLAALADASVALRTIYVEGGSTEHVDALDHLEGHTDRAGRGVVWDSFWSAWDAFEGARDYRGTIQRAVAYGEDTDTTAAIAGGLAGIRWGIGGIPFEWLRGMRGREIVEPLVCRLTKPENPIRVDWVDLAKAPGLASSMGRLGMTFLPGKHHDGSAGKHRRDLDADVRWLRSAYAVDAFVLLNENWELLEYKVPTIAEAMAANGIDLIRHPIEDMDIPTDAPKLRTVLDGVTDRINDGQNVAVACLGGLGRTGTIVGCFLRDAGLDGPGAIALTRGARHGTIQTPAQERFVESWK